MGGSPATPRIPSVPNSCLDKNNSESGLGLVLNNHCDTEGEMSKAHEADREVRPTSADLGKFGLARAILRFLF
jgi:hypothetical protein